MSLVHPLSTGSASKFYKCFGGELFFQFSWIFVSSVMWRTGCVVESDWDVFILHCFLLCSIFEGLF